MTLSDYVKLNETYSLSENYRGGKGIYHHNRRGYSGYLGPGGWYNWYPYRYYYKPYLSDYVYLGTYNKTEPEIFKYIYNIGNEYPVFPTDEQKDKMKKTIQDLPNKIKCSSIVCKADVSKYITTSNINDIVSEQAKLQNFMNDLILLLNKYIDELRK